MEASVIKSVQNQFVTYLNQHFKTNTQSEILIDKTILTCCPSDEDIRLIMDAEFRKQLINNGLYYCGTSDREQLCIQKIKSYPLKIYRS